MQTIIDTPVRQATNTSENKQNETKNGPQIPINITQNVTVIVKVLEMRASDQKNELITGLAIGIGVLSGLVLCFLLIWCL